jgi:hypothetical protein
LKAEKKALLCEAAYMTACGGGLLADDTYGRMKRKVEGIFEGLSMDNKVTKSGVE